MDDSTIVKITAIISLVVLEAINLLTTRMDGNIMLTFGAIIGGVAGYEIGRSVGTGNSTKSNKIKSTTGNSTKSSG